MRIPFYEAEPNKSNMKTADNHQRLVKMYNGTMTDKLYEEWLETKLVYFLDKNQSQPIEKERDQFAMKFLEYASGLAISNFKSGGTWYLSDGTFVKTENILEQFKALESSPTEQPEAQKENCPKCNGTGNLSRSQNIYEPCGYCNESGVIEQQNQPQPEKDNIQFLATKSKKPLMEKLEEVSKKLDEEAKSRQYRPQPEKCQAGCKVFTGGEIRHHKDCVYYPESFSKMYDDLKAKSEPHPEKAQEEQSELWEMYYDGKWYQIPTELGEKLTKSMLHYIRKITRKHHD